MKETTTTASKSQHHLTKPIIDFGFSKWKYYLKKKNACLMMEETGDIIYIYETENSTTFLPAIKECPKTKKCIIDNVSP
jgi:hypothetical protein